MSHVPSHRQNAKSNIPFIEISASDKPQIHRRPSNISISSASSEESLPFDAPLARQKRCSVDIDMIKPQADQQFQNGVSKQRNAYLDDMPLRESIQDIPYENVH